MTATQRQTLIYVLAALSFAASASMVAVAFLRPSIPIMPIIVVNWLLFIGTMSQIFWPISRILGRLTPGDPAVRMNHGIAAAVLVAFVACAFVAMENGATPV